MDKSQEIVVIHARVPVEVRDRVDQLAERMGIDRTRVLHTCLIAGLEEGERLAEYCAGDVTGKLLLLGAMAVGGVEGYEKVRQAVEAAREWDAAQDRLPGLEGTA